MGLRAVATGRSQGTPAVEPACPPKAGAAWFYGIVALVGLAIVAADILRRRRLV